ncbi:uncharacterized protein [Chelonus insularis]|uniref:uncharacterized protein n=1 Tax=Chelonus insularis TaxID=460826 RepID=UPI001589E61A|nr:uncharacterized protein LOC118068380 [Chelonus insularis]
MLCNVISIWLSHCLNLKFIQLFIILWHSFKTEGALPPGAEDEIILIEHLPGRQVHLQDFFWTGAEDAPPWLDPDQMLTFYETRTIHHTATVYVPGEDSKQGDNEPRPYDPGCTSCIDPTPTIIEDEGIGVLVGSDPGPRYWLLTVLRTGESVPPKVELRLARLYRAAFARQQQRHLGLLSTDPRLRRVTKKRSPSDNLNVKFRETTDNGLNVLLNDSSVSIQSPSDEFNGLNQSDIGKKMREVKIPNDKLFIAANLNTEVDSLDRIDELSSKKSTRKIVEDYILTTDTSMVVEVVSEDSSINKNIKNPQALRSHVDEFYPDFPNESDIKLSFDSNTYPSVNEKQDSMNQTDAYTLLDNQKKVHEVKKISDSNTPNSRLRIKGIDIVQVRMQNTTVLDDGSTRLIYSVHLDGKPVPAETAAKDMALLSPQEVALELGAPVVIQSEPYLKETRPLALSRSRDAWLLIGTAGTAIIILVLVIAGLIITAKKKRAYSAVSAPPNQSILKNDKVYSPSTLGLDNTGYTSETEGRTDGTSQRQTPPSNSRTPITTPITPNTLNDDIQELSSDNEQDIKGHINETWDSTNYSTLPVKSKSGKKRLTKSNAIERSESSDSMETVDDCHERRKSENGRVHSLEETASPHSYLSMPSCKLFPSMRSVEPLSRILEPSVIRNLDIEFETPEMSRRENGLHNKKLKDDSFERTRSTTVKDPGVVGPIVWDLRKHRNVEENSETDPERQLLSSGPVGRARRRLHELLEDSFSLFGTKDVKTKEVTAISTSLHPPSVAISPDRVTMCSEWKEKSIHPSPAESPKDFLKIRPRTSLPRNLAEESIPETGNTTLQPRGAWGSRPMSAGPFHRPNLPEVTVTQISANSPLTLEDPAVPLIAAIRKELEKFTPEQV